MIQITPHMRIMLAVESVDFRKGIDGLAGICRRVLQVDPFSGSVFIFRNRKGTSLKILLYDGQGFWLCQKRLSTGRFRWWPDKIDQTTKLLAVHELQLLLWNGNPSASPVGEMWKKIEAQALFTGHI
ncbi:MAG: IS66 family insertion sequence element accessory protein TnpB [Desulfobacterales bacterium]|nr:MAG: IS66 family insertion sequence element accessory protein TnpB [Desulfobacterales bacterium]